MMTNSLVLALLELGLGVPPAATQSVWSVARSFAPNRTSCGADRAYVSSGAEPSTFPHWHFCDLEPAIREAPLHDLQVEFGRVVDKPGTAS